MTRELGLRARDRGDAPISWVLGMVTVWVVVVLLANVITQMINGATLSHALLTSAWILGGTFAVCIALGVIAGIVFSSRHLRRHRVDHQLGPVLRDLLNVDRLYEWELDYWRRCRRRGYDLKDAQRWSRDGLPYPLMVAGPRTVARCELVRALADVMVDAGAWDGGDRRQLVDLIGFHMEVTGHSYPVLARWLSFPQTTIRFRVAAAVASADINMASTPAKYRASAAARAILYDLEDEHGIKGYRHRPQRPVHQSWLVHG